jgi:hypothetical protein
MVLALDVVTVEPAAAVRALVPLVLALFFGLIVTVVLSVVHRVRRRRSRAADGAREENVKPSAP